MTKRDYYEVLGLSKGASLELVESKRLAAFEKTRLKTQRLLEELGRILEIVLAQRDKPLVKKLTGLGLHLLFGLFRHSLKPARIVPANPT